MSLGQHNDLSPSFVFLHATMRLDDFVEVESLANLDVQWAPCDLIDQFLKGGPHEVFRFSGIGGQADRSRDRVHGSEILERPFIADYASHANAPTLFGAAVRLFQRRLAHQFEHLVDAPRTYLFYLFGE